ncbi:MAG: IS110 family RNA-guided transposase [Planctomycetota bacterium]|jgi:transposase
MVEYVGLDVSKEATAYCVKDEKGKVLARGKAASDPDALFEVLQEHCLCPERIVVETGTLSNWLARELGRRGLPVTIIDARQAHAVLRLQHNKTDENDATILAELARMGFYRAVAIKSERAQRWRILLKARAHLVAQRRSRQNVIRGLLGTLGIRFPKGSGKFARRVRAVLVEQGDLAVMFEPLVDELAALERAIKRLDRAVEAEARAEPACRLLMTVPAVGPVTALAYLATIDEAGRFAKSRALGAYLGLTSRRNQSGEMDYSGRISKQGDRLLRALLYGAANSLLTRVRRAHPLKAWARRVKKRTSHKKACVALARKLAVIMHRMLMTGEAFAWPTDTKETATA